MAAKSASPAGTVYIDSNNSGTFNAGEPTTVTNVSGGYSFTGLAAGSYRLNYTSASAIRPVGPAHTP